MNDTERTAWDRRYREGTHQSLTPDPLLVSAYDEFVAPGLAQPGQCLDLAGGVGRHAIFLAERGWDVTLLDISAAALEIAKSESGKHGLHIVAEQADLAETPLPTATFDLILNFFYLERTLFSRMAAALNPGGLLIFKTYTREQLRLGGGPTHPMHLLESNELLRAFSGLRILHYHESIKDKAVAELVARKE
jgi:tellurite methyltransferase